MPRKPIMDSSNYDLTIKDAEEFCQMCKSYIEREPLEELYLNINKNKAFRKDKGSVHLSTRQATSYKWLVSRKLTTKEIFLLKVLFNK